MADVREQRIYCAEQIVVPDELPAILKNYSKEVIRNNPKNIIEFSAKYFRDLVNARDGSKEKQFSEINKPDSKQKI